VKHPHAAHPGHARTRRLSVRLSEHDRERLVERAIRAGAKTPSAYLRACGLTGLEAEMPPWATLRDMRNELIRLTGEIQNSPPGPVRDRALEKAIDALDRISRF
jgi:hypothetical protein